MSDSNYARWRELVARAQFKILSLVLPNQMISEELTKKAAQQKAAFLLGVVIKVYSSTIGEQYFQR
ncbi:hypothetical protein HMPREF1551_01080 [Capnocytophaga sp. oral taxon 863 str. F0517]|nr:hypothetical protein HMPREF1551_01080 [Capnocytophaga sp. oral taxon 863 str. F0517]